MGQVLREMTWENALLALLHVNRVDRISKVESGHSNCDGLKFKIPGDMRKSASKMSALDMRRAELQAAQGISKVPWDNAFSGAEVYQCWSLFKHPLLRAQEQAIPKCWKSSR